jgi:hypothetical protein
VTKDITNDMSNVSMLPITIIYTQNAKFDKINQVLKDKRKCEIAIFTVRDGATSVEVHDFERRVQDLHEADRVSLLLFFRNR